MAAQTVQRTAVLRAAWLVLLSADWSVAVLDRTMADQRAAPWDAETADKKEVTTAADSDEQ
jgi:hypothetical protein